MTRRKNTRASLREINQAREKLSPSNETPCSAGELQVGDHFTFSGLFREPQVKCVGRSNRDRVLYVHLSWGDSKIKPCSISKAQQVFKPNVKANPPK